MFFNKDYEKFARLDERQKKDKESIQEEFKRVNKRIENLESVVSDLPEIKQLTHIISNNLQEQKQMQMENQKTQTEFAKTQALQAQVLEKISFSLDEHNKKIDKLETKLEDSKTQEDAKYELRFTQMDQKIEKDRKEILEVTYNDKKEINANIEKVLEKIEKTNEKGQIDIVEGAKSAIKYIAVAILGFLVKFFMGG